MPLVQRHMEETGFCTELLCFIGPHPSHLVKPCSSFLCLCLEHARGEQAWGSHRQHERMTGSVAKPKAMSVASSLWSSSSSAAGASAGCPALGSPVQSHDTQCRLILWASAASQVCAASTALSGCLLMLSAPTEVPLLSCGSNKQLSQILPSFLCTRIFTCTVHRLRVAHCSSVYFIKDCSHMLYFTSMKMVSSSVTLNPPSPHCPYYALPQPFLTILSYTYL